MSEEELDALRENMTPLADLGYLSEAERDDYYANIGTLLEAGMSEEEAANLIFGPDDF